jgi:hypothetical protein
MYDVLVRERGFGGSSAGPSAFAATAGCATDFDGSPSASMPTTLAAAGSVAFGVARCRSVQDQVKRKVLGQS